MKNAQYTPDKTIDFKVFRANWFAYLNKETIDLGQHHFNNIVETVAYNLKDGIGIRTYMLYSEENRNTPVSVQIDVKSDVAEVDGLYEKIQAIAKESKKK